MSILSAFWWRCCGSRYLKDRKKTGGGGKARTKTGGGNPTCGILQSVWLDAELRTEEGGKERRPTTLAGPILRWVAGILPEGKR